MSTAIPPDVAAAASEVLGLPGSGLEARRIGGGCIHPAARVSAPDGGDAFLKWATDPGAAGFGVEARGLEALAGRGGLRVPRVLGWGEGGPAERGWLLLEYLPPAPADASTEERLGRGLARLHRPLDAGASPGWEEPGWIGSLPQENPTLEPWPAFWAEARILPQLRWAGPGLSEGGRRSLDAIMERMDEALAGWEADGLSLLHGDLWSGNVLVTSGGEPAIVDPAAYRGHREVDLAMMELFGGFGSRVFGAYGKHAPIAPGYRKRRRHAYQLYPLLVHVNLFGGGYAARTEEAARAALASLG